MEETINAIKNLFIVRDDCYPKQLKGQNLYTVIKDRLTDEMIKNHLVGTDTIGCWQTDITTKNVKWVCFDFDGELEEEYRKAEILYNKLKDKGYNPLMEFSGRRGYHVWIFLEPTAMAIARRFVLEMSNDSGVSDIYPKSDNVDAGGYGFQVKLPLGIHRASSKRSFLLDETLKSLSQQQGEEFLIRINREKRDRIKITNIDSFLP